MNKRVDDWIEQQPDTGQCWDISVVVPAYNEERRLPPTLIEMIDYFDARKLNYELIVVDDGSLDRTSEIVHRFERIRPQVRLIRIPDNHGKGHAVRCGILNARGDLILFADADGATPIAELERLEVAIAAGADMAIGSRAKASTTTKIATLLHRRVLGRIFNAVVNFVVVPGIEDTQCGFKLFRAPVAKKLFQIQKSDGFSFDVEIIHIAQKLGLKLAEVPINWTNIPGSKVNLVTDSLRMLRDTVIFRYRHRGITPQNTAGSK